MSDASFPHSSFPFEICVSSGLSSPHSVYSGSRQWKLAAPVHFLSFLLLSLLSLTLRPPPLLLLLPSHLPSYFDYIDKLLQVRHLFLFFLAVNIFCFKKTMHLFVLCDHFRETVVLAQSCAADQAHLRSHSGPFAQVWCCVDVQHHQSSKNGLRLPLMITEARCECRRGLDVRGQHRAACPRSGRLRSRAVPMERTQAVCREAGATVRINTRLRDMNLSVPAIDERTIEVLASGLPMNHGAQLAVDITTRSAGDRLRKSVPERCHCGWVRAHRSQTRQGGSTQSCCKATGVSLSWSELRPEAGGVPRQSRSLKVWQHREHEKHQMVRFSFFLAWQKRWSRTYSISCCRAFCTRTLCLALTVLVLDLANLFLCVLVLTLFDSIILWCLSVFNVHPQKKKVSAFCSHQSVDDVEVASESHD